MIKDESSYLKLRTLLHEEIILHERECIDLPDGKVLMFLLPMNKGKDDFVMYIKLVSTHFGVFHNSTKDINKTRPNGSCLTIEWKLNLERTENEADN